MLGCRGRSRNRTWASPAPQPLIPGFLQVGGAAVLAVGVWTLVEKSGYLSVLASSTFAASAYILIFAGALVMVTGFLGFSAIIREDRSCLSTVSAARPARLWLAGGKPARASGSKLEPLTAQPVPPTGSCAENPTCDGGPCLQSEALGWLEGTAALGWAVCLSLQVLRNLARRTVSPGAATAPRPFSLPLQPPLLPDFIMLIFKAMTNEKMP